MLHFNIYIYLLSRIYKETSAFVLCYEQYYMFSLKLFFSII